MKQVKSKLPEQVLYMGRHVDKRSFRTFVYNKLGEQKMANNYQEYLNLINHKQWFSSKEDAAKAKKSDKKLDVSVPTVESTVEVNTDGPIN